SRSAEAANSAVRRSGSSRNTSVRLRNRAPDGSPSIRDRSARILPLTMTTRAAVAANRLRGASCTAAPESLAAAEKPMPARGRSVVYFQASILLCGHPTDEKRRKPASRRAVTAACAPPGSSLCSAANWSTKASAPGAMVVCRLMARSSICKSIVQVISGSVGSSGRVHECPVTLLLELHRQFLAARRYDAAVGKHVHLVRDDVVEQSLIVRNHNHRAVRGAQLVDAVGDDPQRVDVETAISLVEHGQLRIEDGHLER